jgi:sulfur carrier protein
MKTKVFLISFIFNGELYNLQTYKLFTLRDLIRFFNYKENLVVLEYNGKILNPKKWLKIKLKNHDHLEILTIVGGG